VEKQPKPRHFAKKLLATTCLTAATASVGAASTTYNGDYSTNSASPTVIPLGAPVLPATMTGSFVCNSDVCAESDYYFEIAGLKAGDTIHVADSESGDQLNFFAANSSATILGSNGSNGSFDVTAPTDGELFFRIQDPTVFNETFQVAITDTSKVPEPATAGVAAASLAAAAFLSRKRKKA
jgi:hypothetical protein